MSFQTNPVSIQDVALHTRPTTTSSSPNVPSVNPVSFDRFDSQTREREPENTHRPNIFERIWNGICSFFKAIGQGIKYLWNSIFGTKEDAQRTLREELSELRNIYDPNERASRFERLYRWYGRGKDAENFFKTTSELTPDLTIQYYEAYKNEPFAQEVLNRAVERDPLTGYRLAGLYRNAHPQAFTTAQTLTGYLARLHEQEGHNNRQRYLHEILLPSINQNIPGALQTFNQNNNLSLRCIGIDPGGINRPFSFVFVHSNPGEPPVRLNFEYNELKNKPPEELDQLLQTRYRETVNSMSPQYEIWRRAHNFNWRRNSVSVMAVNAPGNVPGTESDYYTMLREVYQNRYSATVQNVLMDDPTRWTYVHGGLLPRAQTPTRTNILRGLASSCDSAIASGHDDFVFHATWHGNRDGSIVASDGRLNPEEIAQVLSLNGRSQNLNITLILESCYSEAQKDRLIACFRKNNIPVRNLRIIATSGRDTPSFAGSNIRNSATINDHMRYDDSGTFAYNFSHYYQLHPNSHAGDAIRYADLMSRTDSITGQDLIAVHYSNSGNGSPVEYQFSRMDRIGEDIERPQNYYTSIIDSFRNHSRATLSPALE